MSAPIALESDILGLTQHGDEWLIKHMPGDGRVHTTVVKTPHVICGPHGMRFDGKVVLDDHPTPDFIATGACVVLTAAGVMVTFFA